MTRRKINPLVPIGLLSLSTSIIVQRLAHMHFTDFTSGLLLGASLGLMFFGLIKQSYNAPR